MTISKRRSQPWLKGLWEVSEEAGWTKHTSLQWSSDIVAIQTQINRGGTSELMIEGGGGVSEGGLNTPEPRSPEKCRTGAHYTHFQPQLRTETPALPLLLPPANSSKLLRPLFVPQLLPTHQICAKVRDFPAVCMATWKFHGLGTWKTFRGVLLELSATIVTVDYWHNVRTFGRVLLG